MRVKWTISIFGLEYAIEIGWLQAFGFVGIVTFGARFFVQWVASEKRGQSVIPIAFWYLSIVGTVICCAYFIARRDAVGILGYLPNAPIYVRNLVLIRRKERARALSAAGTDRQG